MSLAPEKIEDIETTSRSILFAESTADKEITLHVQTIVLRQLIDMMTSIGSTTFSDQDVRKISRNLAAGKSASYQTYIKWKTFNFLADKLNKRKIIKCPIIEIPNKQRRFLLFTPADNTLRNLTYIQGLHDYLLRFNEYKADPVSYCKLQKDTPPNMALAQYLWEDFSRTAPADKQLKQFENAQKRTRWRQNLKDRELEYLFSFIAAAAIFGKVLFDEYYKWLLQLNPDDIHLTPCYINRTYQNTNAIRRYFLPAPAAAYLMRCMGFYKRNRNKMQNIEGNEGHYWVANPDEILDNFGKKFKKWTASKLKDLNCEGLTPTDFRLAVIASSQLDLMDGHASHNSYPPFILSIQSDQIDSHAYGNLHFPYFMGVTPDRIDYKDRSAFDRRAYEFRKSELATVIAEITPLRRSLMELGMHYTDRRKQILTNIYAVLERHRQKLDAGDTRNLELFISWFSNMVLYDDDEFSSMNTYAGQVPSLLYRMIGIGALDELSAPDLIQVIRQTMFEYDSPGIKNALSNFCNYHGSIVGAPFSEIDWTSKTLSKEKVKSMKSFVRFDQLDQAVDLAEDFYCAYAHRLRKKKGTKDKIEAAKHKARVIELAIQLAYYTGMRVSEIMRIRLRHIKNGKFLTIYKTKTDNGKRNIPFYILLPSSVSSDFVSYYQQRKNEVETLDELLFVQKNGKKWNSSQISRDVARLFSVVGVRNFHFHHLRHSAANIYLFRFLEAYYPDLIPRNAPILSHELFGEHKLKMLKFMINGVGDQRTGEDVVDFALHTLARLMGHGGPQVTIQEYVHCSDIIFYLMSLRHNNEKVPYSIRQAMDFLQCTYKQLPPDIDHYVDDGKITLAHVLNYQHDSLKRTHGNCRQSLSSLISSRQV